ncbi:MAG: hypothetical protein GXO47_03970 [Chlorobi bacterium]|nr:hypothetical protein [Chlorobiota bacterium]
MKLTWLYTILILFLGCKKNEDKVYVNKHGGTYAGLVVDSLISISVEDTSGYENVIDKNISEALNVAETNGLKRKIFSINILIAKRYSGKAKYSTAIKYANKALLIANELNDDLLKAEALQEMAVYFRKINENSRALKLHTQALDYAENVKDTFLIHCSYNGIGNIYFEYKDYEKAIDYFHKSLNFLGKNPPNILGDAINSNLLGESWLYMGNTDSAMYYLVRSFEANVKLGSPMGKGICYNGFGLIYKKKKEYSKAIESFKKAITFFDFPGDAYYIAMAHYNLGETYLEMQKLRKAEFHLSKANELSSLIGNKRFVIDALIQLAKLNEQMGLYHKACENSMKALDYKDSITKEIQKQETEAMKVLYKAEKQEREIIILKQRNQLVELDYARQKYIMIIIIGLTIMLLSAGLFIYRQKRLKTRLKETGLQQRLLRAQMNPHFIFNSLGAIQNFMYKNETKKAAFYLGSFSSLMRSILNNSRAELITLEEEIRTLSDYLELQKMRLGFNYSINCSEDIDREFTLIPPMLLQPFVENAIKHGIKDMAEKGLIKVSFVLRNNKIVITIDDNGVGINYGSTPEKDHKSIALKIFKERISFLSNYLKKEIIYQIIDKSETKSGERGTMIIVELPLIMH